MTGIYQILHIESGKRYIGSSVNVRNRLYHHKDRLKYGKHANDYLQKAYNKYGIGGFEFKKILECSKENLEFYEQSIIDGYKSNQREFGFNLREVSRSNAGMKFNRNTYKSGETYNRLTFLHLVDFLNGKPYWLFQCSCGNQKKIGAADVKSGHTKSCGCQNKEKSLQNIINYNSTSPDPWNKSQETKDQDKYLKQLKESYNQLSNQVKNVTVFLTELGLSNKEITSIFLRGA